MSTKRALETPGESEEFNSEAVLGKKQKAEGLAPTLDGETKETVMECRVLIDNHQVGGIIGKAGANVRKVRTETGAIVSILKAEFRDVKERVMVIKGTVAQIAVCTGLLAQLLVDGTKARDKKVGGSGASVSTTEGGADQIQYRILIHKNAVGAIIGKGGATIKETQTETGTRMQVSNEPLAQSTEKTVTITGAPAAIQHAALRVLTQLHDNPLRSGTSTYFYVPGQPSYSYGGAMTPYTAPSPQATPSAYGTPAHAYRDGTPAHAYPAPAVQQQSSTQKIAIPTVCAGCVIGKGGYVIKDLRAQSGTSISIADPDASTPDERVVTLSGTPQGIETAVYLIRQLVEQYQPPPQY